MFARALSRFTWETDRTFEPYPPQRIRRSGEMVETDFELPEEYSVPEYTSVPEGYGIIRFPQLYQVMGRTRFGVTLKDIPRSWPTPLQKNLLDKIVVFLYETGLPSFYGMIDQTFFIALPEYTDTMKTDIMLMTLSC